METIVKKPTKVQSKKNTALEKLVDLMNANETPSISIIHKKSTPSTRHEEFKISFKNEVKKALDELDKFDLPKRTVDYLKNELQDIEEKLPLMDGFKSVGVFVSPFRTEIIPLPIEAPDRVVVDDNSFEVRDLLRAVNRAFKYDIVILSKKKTRFIHGFEYDLLENEHNLPQGIDHYLNTRIKDKIDPAKAETEAAKIYVHEVDHFIRQHSDMNTPLIVMGDEKEIAYFKNYTKRPKKILAEITGNYIDSNLADIKDKISAIFPELLKKRDEQLLARIKDDIDNLNYAAGIQDCWTAAAMREARVLLVEQGYTEEGYSVENGLFLTFSKPEEEEYEYHADIIDDLTEMVLAQGGEVYFVQPGLLDKFDKIVMTTRF
jgi:hypothetical protein